MGIFAAVLIAALGLWGIVSWLAIPIADSAGETCSVELVMVPLLAGLATVAPGGYQRSSQRIFLPGDRFRGGRKIGVVSGKERTKGKTRRVICSLLYSGAAIESRCGR